MEEDSREIINTEIITVSYEAQLTLFEEHILGFLKKHDLPTEGIFVTISERMNVFNNAGGVLAKIDPAEKNNSIYLSKFLAAAASGLFDAALNYIWDETVLQLRKRVVQYDLDYFYDNAVGGEKRSNLKNEADLIKLDDSELIHGAKEIGLISDLGYRHLDFIKYMRNWASAAHPNQNEISGLQLVAWFETCFREVISLPLSTMAVKIKQLLGSIKAGGLSKQEAEEIGVSFTNLNPDQIQNFAAGLFGIYTNALTDTTTKQNVAYLLPLIWSQVEEDTRQTFGLKFAQFTANNYLSEKRAAREFLQIVAAESYIPDELRIVEVENTINDLLVAHNGMNNFYTEVTFAKQLRRAIGENPKVPKGLDKKYIYALVTVFITNGHGVASGAEPIYLELLEKLTPLQAAFAITSFIDGEIYSKFQFSLCEKKFRQMLSILKPKIISEPVRDLILEIEKIPNGKLSQIKVEPKIMQAIDSLKVILK